MQTGAVTPLLALIESLFMIGRDAPRATPAAMSRAAAYVAVLSSECSVRN